MSVGLLKVGPGRLPVYCSWSPSLGRIPILGALHRIRRPSCGAAGGLRWVRSYSTRSKLYFGFQLGRPAGGCLLKRRRRSRCEAPDSAISGPRFALSELVNIRGLFWREQRCTGFTSGTELARRPGASFPAPTKEGVTESHIAPSRRPLVTGVAHSRVRLWALGLTCPP